MGVIIMLIALLVFAQAMIIWMFYDFQSAMEFMDRIGTALNKINQYLNKHVL